jgi:protein gp37
VRQVNKTSISWTNYSWNPVVGCSKRSPGCASCYAEELHSKRHKAYQEGKKLPKQYAKPFNEIQLFPERLEEPLKLRKPSKIFVCSVADLFHEDVPDEFIDKVMATVIACPQHTFQILTKRADNMRDYFKQGFDAGQWFDNQFPNLWLGTTCENQEQADKRIPILLQIPAAVRFVSVEPLLSPVDIQRYLKPEYFLGLEGVEKARAFANGWAGTHWLEHLNWVIAGSESGKNRRSAEADWFRSLRDQCIDTGTPYFLKQMEADGKVVGMPELDNVIWNQFPEENTDANT